MKKGLIHTTLSLAASILLAAGANAEEPSGYYKSCEGKCGAALLEALCDVIGPHTTVSYGGLWTMYKDSDTYPEDGKIWDMYSTKHWTYKSEQCGNVGSVVGICYNREHSFPKSWFNDASPMVSDGFHIYPTDGKVNGQRGNYPYGECEGGEQVKSNNSAYKALGRFGDCTYPGYSGKVFEPDDMYKGDFARTYFYMAACYNDRISSWSSPMLSGDNYPVFSSWAVNLLLDWHRADAVSKKETDRNDAVYGYQKNRNPFIDHPELAEHIWGNKKNEPWQGHDSRTPSINMPADASTLNLGMAGTGVTKTLTIGVKGSNLTSAVSVSISGEGFSADRSSLSASAVNAEAGASLVLSYMGYQAGEFAGTLKLVSGGAASTVTLKVTVADGIPVTAPVSVSEDSFTFRWTYVGDDADGNYTLDVRTASDDKPLQGYPRSVSARAEIATVGGLTPETAYTYAVASASVRSVTHTVTTAAPQPSVSFYSDEDFTFTAAPGEISQVQEIGVDVENITDDITISVSEPFAVSIDNQEWGTTLVFPAEADRIYMRFAPVVAGTFVTSIRATAGNYFTDDAEVTGTAVETSPYLEDFEGATASSSYTTGTIEATMGPWDIVKCGRISENSGIHIRMGKKDVDSSIAMAHDKAGGIGTVSVDVAPWSSTEGGYLLCEYSTDSGLSWQEAGGVEIPTSDTGFHTYTFTVNKPAANRVRFIRTQGGRLKLDNVALGDCHSSGIEGVESDYRAWDACCRSHSLVLTYSGSGNPVARIYGTDGILYAAPALVPGEISFRLPAGLYIVAVEDYARRVVVR